MSLYTVYFMLSYFILFLFQKGLGDERCPLHGKLTPKIQVISFLSYRKLPQHSLINIENDDDDDWTEHWRYKNYRTYLHEAYITTHCLTTLDLLPLDFIQ